MIPQQKREFTTVEQMQIRDAQENLMDAMRRMLLAGYPKDILAEALTDMLLHPDKFFK